MYILYNIFAIRIISKYKGIRVRRREWRSHPVTASQMRFLKEELVSTPVIFQTSVWITWNFFRGDAIDNLNCTYKLKARRNTVYL